MNLLVITATQNEALSLINRLLAKKVSHNKYISQLNTHTIEFLIAGVGGVFTAYNLTKQIAENRPDIIINTGIAGSFNLNIELGSVVNIISEEFGDLGFEDDNQFVSFMQSGLIDKNLHPFNNGKIHFSQSNISKTLNELPKKESVCVNKTHGNQESINKFRKHCSAEIENMEGAACGFVGLAENIDTYEIRAISNYVTKRNFSEWQINLAIDNLTEITYQIITEICND